jgi:flavin-binding protein dodecin
MTLSIIYALLQRSACPTYEWDNRRSGRNQPDDSLKENAMSVAKVSEISATSSKSFEDAIQQGISRASKTLRNVRGAWVKEQHVRCENGKIVEYQVNMMVTFVLDD